MDNLSSNAFVQKWSRRLLRAYGVWAILSLLAYIVILIIASKGTFPGGFQRLSAICLLCVLVSGGLLLLVSAVNAFALVGTWQVAFPRLPAPVRWLWYLSFPFPVLQVWGFLAAAWRELKFKWAILAVLAAASGWLGWLLFQIKALPAVDTANYLGFVLTAFAIIMVVLGRIFWVLGQVHLTRMGYRLVMSLVGLGLLCFFVPQVLMSQAEQRLTWVYGELAKLEVPRDIKAQEQAYFQGAEPHKTWTHLVEGYVYGSPQSDPQIAAAVKLLKIYEALEQGKIKLVDVTKNCPETSREVKFVNQLIDQPKLFRYARNYQIETLSGLAMPELNVYRRLAYFCRARGQAAFRAGNLKLAQKYWTRCHRISDALTATPDLLISSLVGISAESMALDFAQEVITSGKLSPRDLAHWESLLLARQNNYYPRFKYASKGEAIYLLDLAQRGLPQVPTAKYRNWFAAPLFCYIQNDLITGLNIYRHILTVFNTPEWRPTNKDAFRDVGFQAMAQLNGMTFTPMLMVDWANFWNRVEYLNTSNKLLRIASKIAAYQLAHKRLPATLAELKTALPLDAVTGKSYTYQADAKKGTYTLQGAALGKLIPLVTNSAQ